MGEPRMGLKWDGTISANTLLTTLPLLVLGVVWAVRLEGRVNTETTARRARESALASRISMVHAAVTAQIAAVHAEDDARMRGIRDLLVQQSETLSRISGRLDEAMRRLPPARNGQ